MFSLHVSSDFSFNLSAYYAHGDLELLYGALFQEYVSSVGSGDEVDLEVGNPLKCYLSIMLRLIVSIALIEI